MYKIKLTKEQIEDLNKLWQKIITDYDLEKSVNNLDNKYNKIKEIFDKTKTLNLFEILNLKDIDSIKKYMDEIKKSVGEFECNYSNPKTSKNKELINIFDYTKFQKSELCDELYDILNLRICPYCGRNYVFTIVKNNNNKLVKVTLDHYYPKAKYPYLAIFPFNLIPSCYTCNSSCKGEQSINFYPYTDSLGEKVKFKYNVNMLYNKEKVIKEHSDISKLFKIKNDLIKNMKIKTEKINEIIIFLSDFKKKYPTINFKYIETLLAKAEISNTTKKPTQDDIDFYDYKILSELLGTYLEITSDNSEEIKKIKNDLDVFKIQEFYSYHSDEVSNLFENYEIYSEDYQNYLIGDGESSIITEKKYRMITKDDIKNYILGNYKNEDSEEKNRNKEKSLPLYKFVRDIAKELGLLDKDKD